jgi:hypothetical protein
MDTAQVAGLYRDMEDLIRGRTLEFFFWKLITQLIYGAP